LLDAFVRALVPLPVSVRAIAEPIAPFPGLRVLVAEDNVINQRVIRGLLGKFGCAVVIAENGAEALDALTNQSFDLVFMDCQMPLVDGFEATRRLRLLHGTGLPVVALTAGNMDGDRQRCLAAGMDDFLAKPVRPEDLQRVISRFVKPHSAIASVG